MSGILKKSAKVLAVSHLGTVLCKCGSIFPLVFVNDNV